MRLHSAKLALLTAVLANAIGCGGDVPASPSSTPGGSSQGIVYIESPAAQREFMGGDTDVYYRAR